MPTELEADLLAHTAETWRQLGLAEPYWSSMADEDYRTGSIDDSLGAFEDSGRGELEGHMGLLDSNGVDVSQLSSVLEYGCGGGRVTRWLADRFGTIHAYDAAPHLKIARRMLEARGCSNVMTYHLRDVPAPGELPGVDFVYCFLVLQHSPIIAQTLRRLLEAVSPGGVALFQVPTYRPGYAFDLDEYMASIVSSPSTGPAFEMHLLPQRNIHAIIAETGCETLEVLQNHAAGPDYVSNTFLVRRARTGADGHQMSAGRTTGWRGRPRACGASVSHAPSAVAIWPIEVDVLGCTDAPVDEAPAHEDVGPMTRRQRRSLFGSGQTNARGEARPRIHAWLRIRWASSTTIRQHRHGQRSQREQTLEA